MGRPFSDETKTLQEGGKGLRRHKKVKRYILIKSKELNVNILGQTQSMCQVTAHHRRWRSLLV
jgi:hypothetical protein